MAYPSSTSRRAAFEQLRVALSAMPTQARDGRARASTGVPELDELIPGGLPRGAISVVDGGLGARALTAALVAGVPGRVTAIVDDATLYPRTLLSAGALLEHILVIPAGNLTSLEILRAVDLTVRSGVCRLLVLPLAILSASRGRITRTAWWVRLAELAQRSGTLLVALDDGDADRAVTALAASVATLQIACAPAAMLWSGSSGPNARLVGYDVRMSVRAYRRDARCIGRSAVIRCLIDEPALRCAPIRVRTMSEEIRTRVLPASWRLGA